MKKLLFIAACAISAQFTQAQLCLSPATNYGASSTPYNVCLADFNNDGNKDAVTVNAAGNHVAVMLGTGTGTFGAATTFTTGSSPQGLCTADFNADGNIDIVVTLGFSGTNKVAILLGTGTGSFGSATSYSVPAGPISVCAGDFNVDGKMDVATANYTANSVSVLFGNGTGTFGAATNYGTMSSGPYEIITSDFNNDNKLDLAITNNTGNNISVLLNQGTGTFGLAAIYGSGTSPYRLCAGDFNGDSKVDIATTYFGDGSVGVLYGDGSGTYYGTQNNYTVGVNPVGICASDLDGDAKLDLAVTNYNGTPQLWVMMGDGVGNFSATMGYQVGSNPYCVVSSDIDGNGKKDVVVANYNSSNISVLLNGPPQASITGTLSYCSSFGGTSLSGSNAQSYTWSTGGSSQYEFVNPGAGTTTYTVTEANGVCTATAVATVTVIPNPTITVTGSYAFCSADSTLLTANGATTYGWVCAGPGCSGWSPLPTTNTLYVNAVHAGGNLTVNGTTNGCTSSVNIPSSTFSVTTSPNFSFVNYPLCSGQSVVLQPGGSTPQTYSWSTGATTQTISVNPSTTTSYTLTEINTGASTCSLSKVVTVNVTATPTVTIGGVHSICLGSSIVLTGSSATSYLWNTGATTQTVSVNPTTTKTYTLVESTPQIGGMGNCSDSATATVVVMLPNTPQICMVSSDSLSKNNIIFWDKNSVVRADSFIVHREVSTGIYKRIGAVSKDSLSMFVDTTRSVGPANGDPNIGYYHYKLQLRDSCGNYSPLSPYHTSVFFVDNHTGTFTWNTYDVEGQPTPVANYILRRDNANNNVYVVVGNVSGSTTTLNDPSYVTYQSVANWRIDATGFNCTPTARYSNNGTQSAIIKSKSNITNNRTTGVKNNVAVSNFSLYPNPTNGNLTVTFANANTGKVSIRVVSMIGQEAYNETLVLSGQSHNIDLSKCEAGVYLVQVTTNNNTVTKRIVKN